MNPTRELRSSFYSRKCYPEHWGPFELHTMFPLSREPPLEVRYYQICVVLPDQATYYLGFDDFTFEWPFEGELSPHEQKRYDRGRNMAQFRALVKVKRVQDLLPEGAERLRDEGADVSEEACREGLWVAVHGKYENLPVYRPEPRVRKPVQVQVIHKFEHHTGDRNLYLRSMDQRTATRCTLYFERIRLRTFMINVSKQDDLHTPIEDRSIEWFIQKFMEQHRFNTAVHPDKEDNYRGARKHTSEVRHTFVCHAEWMLRHSNLHSGPDRVISERVLTQWAEAAPLMRETAVNEGRAGWGVWDYVWDKVDFLEWYHKECFRLRHWLGRIRRDAELTRDEKMKSDSSDDGDEANDGRVQEARRLSKKSSKKTRAPIDKGKGRAKTEDDYMYTWTKGPSSEENDDASLDDEPADRTKRPRIDVRSSPSLGEWNPSPSRHAMTSSAGAGPSNSRVRAPLTPESHAELPSRSASHAGLSRAGLGLSGTSDSDTGPSRSPLTNILAKSACSKQLQPDIHRSSEAASSTRFPSRYQNRSMTSSSNVRFVSPPHKSSSRSLETRLSRLSTGQKERDVITISSDDDDMEEVDDALSCSRENEPNYGSEDAHSVIEIHDTTSEDDQPMHDLSEDELQEDDGGPEVTAEASRSWLAPRRSVSQRSIVSETPPRTRPRRTGRLNTHPLTTPSEEEVSDSQESMNSSDSESKYARKDRSTPTAAMIERRKIIELNDLLLMFAPMVHSFPDTPSTWSPWKCTYPPLNLQPSAKSIPLARKYSCSFLIDLLRPSVAMLRLLTESSNPIDAEFVKHLTTEPCIFKGPRDELVSAIFARVVELHREEHFKAWGVKRIIRPLGYRGITGAHFEPL